MSRPGQSSVCGVLWWFIGGAFVGVLLDGAALWSNSDPLQSREPAVLLSVVIVVGILGATVGFLRHQTRQQSN
jgi:hypothetical protein